VQIDERAFQIGPLGKARANKAQERLVPEIQGACPRHTDQTLDAMKEKTAKP
jgi:hypothetical protein